MSLIQYSGRRSVIGAMPGRQKVQYAGLEFSVSPDFWLRRVSHFPLYFESHNPVFRIDIKRVSGPPEGELWADDVLEIQIVLADGSTGYPHFPVPNLKVGESHRLKLEPIFATHPGQMVIRLPESPRSRNARGLYSYYVRTEEQLWLALVASAVAVGSGAIGFFIERWLG